MISAQYASTPMADAFSRTGKVYFDADILAYVDRLHGRHDEALEKTYSSCAKAGLPEIHLAPSEGKLLELLVRLTNARRLVEVGTLAGYSAQRMARAMGPDGHIWTIESDPHHAQVATENLKAAGFESKVSVLVGAGCDVLPTLTEQGPFCLVFIDADKENYDLYGRWALDHLRPGGLVVADNAFLFADLMQNSRRGNAMRALHEMVARECDSVCIPTPDGLLVGMKRNT